MLFSEYSYFQHKFPTPQYLGAKSGLLSWIHKFIPQGTKNVLDGFGGSQSIAFFFKQLGFKTYTNDFLNFNNQIGLGLIENNQDILNNDDIQILLNNTDLTAHHLFQDTYQGLFFDKKDSMFLDTYRANIENLDNIYKKALAFTTINRAMTRKTTMGHFAHTKALEYASNPERIKRNASIARPLIDIRKPLIKEYNDAVFNNGQDNKSFCMNIIDLLKNNNIDTDLVYYDPPYCDSHADYQSFYHVLETFVNYWTDKEFVNGIKRYEPQIHSGFDKKAYVIDSFQKLFELSKDIPNRLISWNDRSYPSPQEIAEMIKPYKNVTIEHKQYTQNKGGKGSVAGSHEILFVCTNKSTFYFK